MKVIDLCPRCHLIIESERMLHAPVVCNHCGNILSGREQWMDKNLAGRFRRVAIGFSVALVGIFIHLVTWDHFFLEAIPLKSKEVLGIASEADLLRLGQICEERKNPTCTEKALKAAFQKQPAHVDTLIQLGKLQYQMKAFDRAAHSLQTYFSRGGKDVTAAYYYAQSLEALNKINDATQYYEYVLKSKEDSLQITVTQKYIHMLRSAGQYDHAIEVIESIREKGSNTTNFLDAELQDLKKKSKESGSTPHSSTSLSTPKKS